MNQVGEKIPDRTRSQERQNWVLLNRTAHSPAAFAEVAARLGIAVQSFSRVARAGLVSIPRKPGRTLGNIVHRFCGLPDNPLCLCGTGLREADLTGSLGWLSGMKRL